MNTVSRAAQRAVFAKKSAYSLGPGNLRSALFSAPCERFGQHTKNCAPERTTYGHRGHRTTIARVALESQSFRSDRPLGYIQKPDLRQYTRCPCRPLSHFLRLVQQT